MSHSVMPVFYCLSSPKLSRSGFHASPHFLQNPIPSVFSWAGIGAEGVRSDSAGYFAFSFESVWLSPTINSSGLLLRDINTAQYKTASPTDL